MNYALKENAEAIVREAIEAVRPDTAVRRALRNISLTGNIYVVAVGKAAWQMANAALKHLDTPICGGIVLTKYGHIPGEIPGLLCLEAGHPVPDAHSYQGTQAILSLTEHLTESDTVLFLLSGGGSALFEKPLISPQKIEAITTQLLACGADIVEINTIRKRLSGVKGGRFAQWCRPARIESVILSDILGDPIDMIASGPAAPDTSTSAQALSIAEKYGISDPEVLLLLSRETPKSLSNVHTQVIGSVRELCKAAEQAAQKLGFEVVFLTDRMDGEAADAGRWMANLLRQHREDGKKCAFIAGGETVVHVKGSGLGGRNQEFALAAAKTLSNVSNACVISVGSDGTDGPTNAAGGYADTDTLCGLEAKGIDYEAVLENNDSYHALKAVDCLIFTGPTGTNVNDISVGLLV